jgi:transposase
MDLIEEKIQIIAKEMQESNANQWTITRIIKDLANSNTKSENKLRKLALEELKKLDPEAGQIYETFSKMKVYTSKETIENFNRGNIIKSLLKETSIPRTVAEKITLEVENQIKDSKINYITTALIRELVNAKLISYGFEKIRNEYTRLGEPLFEIAKKILLEPLANEQTREYNLLKILPRKIVEKHFSGEIFLEDISGFSTRIYSYAFICKKKETLEKTIVKNIKNIVTKNKYFSNTPNLYGLTFVTAPFLKTEAQTKRTSKIIKELLQIKQQDFSNSLELFIPSKFSEFAEHKLKAVELANYLLGLKSSVIQIDSKYCLKLIENKEKEFLIINNQNEEYFAMNKKLFSTTQGIDFFVNVNLEKILEDNEDDYLEKIDFLIDDLKKLKELKQKELASKSYLNDFCITEMKTGIGLTSILNIAENKNKDISNKIYKKFSNEESFNLFGLGSEKAKTKFSTVLNREVLSHDPMSFDDCLESKKCCFTGNAKTIKEVNELLDKKIKQIYYNGKTK